jgi:hypothetical protein
MKKITLAAIAVIFVFTLADFSFAANDFQIKGTITQINGNQITIKDNQGKEVSISGNADGIKTGDRILVDISIKPDNVRKLTAEEKDFLIKQCLIDSSDLEIIPELSHDTQAQVLNRVAARDCSKFASLKASRNYYKSLKPGAKIPLAPAGWNISWLTDKEFQRYLEILDKAPW